MRGAEGFLPRTPSSFSIPHMGLETQTTCPAATAAALYRPIAWEGRWAQSRGWSGLSQGPAPLFQ